MQCLCKVILVPEPIDFCLFFQGGEVTQDITIITYINLFMDILFWRGVSVVRNVILNLSVQDFGSSFSQMRK